MRLDQRLVGDLGLHSILARAHEIAAPLLGEPSPHTKPWESSAVPCNGAWWNRDPAWTGEQVAVVISNAANGPSAGAAGCGRRRMAPRG